MTEQPPINHGVSILLLGIAKIDFQLWKNGTDCKIMQGKMEDGRLRKMEPPSMKKLVACVHEEMWLAI